MALPVVEYFNVDEQNYSIEIPVDDRLTFPEDNAVESEAVATAKATLPDFNTKQPRKVSASVLNAMMTAGITAARTVEECIRAFIAGFTNEPKANDLRILTSGGAYADKADYPIKDSRKNMTSNHIGEFFMNSPTPESWLGKVLGPKLVEKSWYRSEPVPSGIYTSFSDISYANGIWVVSSLNNQGLWYGGNVAGGVQFYLERGKDSATQVEIPYAFSTVRYLNGIWLAASYGQGIWWSINGKTWTRGEYPDSGRYAYDFEYANGIYVAAGNFVWSEDGKSWHDSLTFAAFNGRKVRFANGIWVGTGTGLWWSTDGKTWTQAAGYWSFSSVYYADGIWVAATPTSDETGGSGLWWSTDGKTWTQATFQGTDVDPYMGFRHVYHGNGIWVASGDWSQAGNYGYGLWWSTDGKTWTRGANNVGGNMPYAFNNAFYANGAWVTGTGTGIPGLWYSRDGKTWTRRYGDVFYHSVRYANGEWVALAGASISHIGVVELGYA